MTNGRSRPAQLQTHEPARPERIVGTVPLAGLAEADAAVTAAEAARPDWAAAASARVAALEAWARAVERERAGIIDLLVREVGKPIREATAEVARAVSILRYYAQAALDPIAEVYPATPPAARLEVNRRPLGTVLLITPWNFPVAIPTWKIAPALAYGNAVIFRPSSAAVVTARRMIQLAHESIPREVLHLLPTTAEDAEHLLGDSRIAGVSFTGSAEVGRRIIERTATRGAAVQAEMGGQNASIVLPGAELQFAAATIADAAMAFAGQKCTATSRVVVDQSIADDFVPMLTHEVRSLAVGDPASETTVVGPLISRSARTSVQKAVDAAVARGGRVLTGAKAIADEGWFYEPTLLALDDQADEFACEETFGPAVSVLLAESADHAVTIANATRYGLAAAVFGATERATAIARNLRAGLVRVNAPTTGVDYYAPFGGEGASSYGPREQGRAAREFYTATRTLTIRPSPSSSDKLDHRP